MKKSQLQDSRNTIELSIEHNHALIRLPSFYDKQLLDSQKLYLLLHKLKDQFGINKLLFDFRHISQFYTDVREALWGLKGDWIALVPNKKMVHELIDSLFDFKKIAVARKELRIQPKKFSLEDVPYLNRNDLNDFLDQCSRNSIMELFALYYDDISKVKVKPFHCYSVYELQVEKETLITRPAILAHRTHTFLIQEVHEFEKLINNPQVKEPELQKFFEDHPHFFRGINPNLCQIYPQILLRASGKEFRPDFILEPVDENWCSVLDIKLPTKKLVVGTKNRKRLSCDVLDGIFQLKEYQRYFEDARNRAKFKQLLREKGAKHDVDCYYPKLVLIIGMNPNELSEDAIRRQLMTMYTDINICTYKQLSDHAKRNLLI